VFLTVNDEVGILDRHGLLMFQFPLPRPPIGGLVHDPDNKVWKVRCQGQIEVVINLTPLGYGGTPAISVVPYGGFTRWFPVVDRMNGWEFAVMRGGRELWVYDHLSHVPVTMITLPARCIRRPTFDDQRKTLCVPLANRTVFFFNAHNYRVGLPAAYTSPVLPGQVIAQPVFDLYNHHTLLQLEVVPVPPLPAPTSRVVALSTATGALAWDSGPMPYTPMCPIQVDCYNKIAKAFYRDPLSGYHEMWLDLYPLVFGAAPNLQWVALGAQAPYGYPQFDSMDGFEIYRLGATTIQARSLFDNTIVYNVAIPAALAMTGNLFVDRVNKYALVKLRGPRVLHIDLFRLTNGMPGAAVVRTFPFPLSAQSTDDIVFLTQLRKAVVHIDNGPATELGVLDLTTGAAVSYPTLVGLPRINRQMVAHPFAGLVNWPHWPGGGPSGNEVTVDFTPTTWNPPQQPQVTNFHLASAPVEAFDTTPPPAVPPMPPLPVQPGDGPAVLHFELHGLEPGSMVLAHLPNVPEFGPTEGTVDDDGICDDISVVTNITTQACFIAVDAAGNTSPETCIMVTPPAGVLDPLPGAGLRFAIAGENPARDRARFALSLPGAGRVTLGIYDVGGRLVATVADRTLEAGAHELSWNLEAGGGRVAAGMYFARLRSPYGQSTVRVAVVQ
jgi:hypothetical protein